MNRLGIFVFYDEDGIVEEYVTYFLDRIRPYFSRLIILCNGELQDEGRDIFSSYSSEVIKRQNEGYDGGAYKYAFIDYLNLSELDDYDEIILFNDTFYGPIYDISEMFDRMESSDADVWGLSEHGKTVINGEIKNTHIQSYFLAITKKVFKNIAFREFWEKMEFATDFNSAVDNFEIAFSRKMSEAGFKLKTYLYEEKYELDDPGDNFNYSQLSSYEMIKRNRFPIYKRKNLINSIPSNFENKRSITYISNNTEYPVEYIWRDSLRRYDIGEIQDSIGFDYDVADTKILDNINYKNVVMMVDIEDQDFYDDIADNILDFSTFIEVNVFIDENIIDRYDILSSNQNISCIKRSEDFNIYNYLKSDKTILKKYKYIGIIVDNPVCKNIIRIMRRILRNTIMEQIIPNSDILKQIISMFENDGSLGIIYPETSADDNWQNVVNNNMKNALIDYNVNAQAGFRIGLDHSVVKGNRVFWGRTKALIDCIDSYHEDERWIWSLPYRIQLNGYHIWYVTNKEISGSIISDYKYFQRILNNQIQEISAREQENARLALEEKNRETEARLVDVSNNYNRQIADISNNFNRQMNDLILTNAIESVISAQLDKKLYIYGCGQVSTRYSNLLIEKGYEITGYIVSDSEDHEDSFMGKPVISLSEYIEDGSNVILIGVGIKLTPVVQKILMDAGINNYMIVNREQPFFTVREQIKFYKNILIEKDKVIDEKDKVIGEKDSIYNEQEHTIFLQQIALDAAPYEYGDFHPEMIDGVKLLEEVIHTGKSLSRFGDGEFQLMQGEDRPWFQAKNNKLQSRLNEVFYSNREDLIVSIPDIFGRLDMYKDNDATNIRVYLQNGTRQKLLDIVGTDRTYYDAYVTRPYLMYKDSENAKAIFKLFKKLWEDKRVLLVEGQYMRSGVGNDLFSNVKSLHRILCPAKNAFDHYDEILSAIKKYLSEIDIVLIGLGPTATVLAYDVSKSGVQTIDLGQIDNEYEWYLRGADERIPLDNKAVPELEGYHTANNLQDDTYESQILERIYCE